MSTEYRLVEQSKKTQIVALETFLKEERDKFIRRIKEWGEAQEDIGHKEQMLNRLDDAVAEITSWPTAVDFDYSEHKKVIGKIVGGKFKWETANGFSGLEDVKKFLAENPGYAIEDEYGKAHTLQTFQLDILIGAAPRKRPCGIPIRHGNILDSGATYIVHQVNCMGVMGSGLAKTIKEKYPAVYYQYHKRCADYKRTPAELLGDCQVVQVQESRFVANCFGQVNYGRDRQHTDYEGLRESLRTLRAKIMTSTSPKDGSIAIPYNLGCGLGGGKWNLVLDIIEDVFRDYPFDVEIWSLDGKTEFVLKEPSLGYYGGPHEKYHDMLSVGPKVGARRYPTEEQAKAKAEKLNKGGYNFCLVEV